MATKSGVSIAISDILIPENKNDILKQAIVEVDDVDKLEKTGVITVKDKISRIDIWTHATNEVASSMMG